MKKRIIFVLMAFVFCLSASAEIMLGDIQFSLGEGKKISPTTGKILVLFPNVAGVDDLANTNFVIEGKFTAEGVDVADFDIEESFAKGVTLELIDFELTPSTDYTLTITSVKVDGTNLAPAEGYVLHFKTNGVERKMSWTFTMDQASSDAIVAEGTGNTEDVTKYIEVGKNRWFVPARNYEEILLPDGTPLPMTEGLLFKFNSKGFYVGDTGGSYKDLIAFNGKNQYVVIPNCQKGDVITFNAKNATKGSATKPTCIQAMYCAAIAPDGLVSSTGVRDSVWMGSSYTDYMFEVQTTGDITFCISNCLLKSIIIDESQSGPVQPEKIWTIAGYGEVLGSDWDNKDASNDMTYTSDSIFQLVKKNVELMAYYNYEFKVVANHSWEENYGQYGEINGPNAYFSVDKDGIYDVTFCWNPNNGNLYATTKQISVSSNANMMYGVENQAFSKGQIQRLGIGMMNEDQITAFQFDIVLPQELSINGIFDTDGSYKMDLAYTNRARNTHIIDAEYQNDGSIRVIGYSSQNDAFRYNDGELLNIGVVVQDWASNGNYYVTLKNIRLINTEGEEFKAKDSWFVISVSGLKGDANNDGQVTMSDVVAIVNYVLGHPNANFNFYNADVNGNGDVTMADVVGVVNIVMGKTAAGARMAQPASLVPGTLTLDAKAGRMSVSLDNTSAYTAFQMDVTLPEGMSINDVAFTGRATSSHVLSMSTLENGKVRILGWSARNADLKGNSGELLTMNLSGIEMVGTVTVDNVLFVTADGMEYKLNAAEIYGETTGISQMENGQRTMDNSYDLQGRKVNSQLKKGLYIINNKKVVVK